MRGSASRSGRRIQPMGLLVALDRSLRCRSPDTIDGAAILPLLLQSRLDLLDHARAGPVPKRQPPCQSLARLSDARVGESI